VNHMTTRDRQLQCKLDVSPCLLIIYILSGYMELNPVLKQDRKPNIDFSGVNFASKWPADIDTSCFTRIDSEGRDIS
jgi:hypothetical protein